MKIVYTVKNMKKKLFILLLCIFLTNVYSQILEGHSPIEDVAASTESTLYWDSLTGKGMYEKEGHYLSFSIDSPMLVFDFTHAYIVDEPFRDEGIVFVTNDFADKVTELFTNLEPEINFRIGAIIIDAGHGGKDPGAFRTHQVDGKSVTVNEKDITLAISKELHTMLSKTYSDKKILLTRDDDTYLKLEERTDIANTVELAEHEAILYISIHVNSAYDEKAKGFEVWYLSPGYRRTLIDAEDAKEVENDVANILNSMLEEEFTTESILIAKYILDGMNAQIGDLSQSRGIKEEEWFVVKNAKMPSVLIETGFVSNRKEALLLNDPSYRSKLTHGIYNGLTAFVSHFEKSRGFTGAVQGEE